MFEPKVEREASMSLVCTQAQRIGIGRTPRNLWVPHAMCSYKDPYVDRFLGKPTYTRCQLGIPHIVHVAAISSPYVQAC